MFTMTFIYMVFEIVIGVKFKCMSLMADAFHMISDVIALTVGYISITVSWIWVEFVYSEALITK